MSICVLSITPERALVAVDTYCSTGDDGPAPRPPGGKREESRIA